MAADASKLKHGDLEKFVTDTLSKREPCPAMVLAWGWMLKQGEGGMFHGDGFKQRYFVLARVPHATVLIYYAEKTMDEENILGFIDLRRVTQVREVSKAITVDGAKGPGGGGGGFMSKLFSRGGGAAAAPLTRNVVELVTPGRIYNLAPATIQMPPPMTTSAALANVTGARPLYLFGWPFPVPPMDTADDEAATAAEFIEGKLPIENFAQWRDVLATAVAAEKATRMYPVTTLVDSTGQLPQRVFLRTTPCELAIVSMEDKDLCFAALPYNDLVKWDSPVEQEIHVTARTRARLVAKPDRSGFSSQRPTRATCHFVFKCTEAKGITSIIDNHLRALAKQLSGLGDGADEAEVAASAAGSVAAGDEADGAAAGGAGGAGAGGADDEESAAAASKLMGKKPKKPAADEGDPEPSPAPRSSASKKAVAVADSDEEDVKPRRKASKKKAADSDEEEEEKPKKKSSKKKADTDSEEEKPKKKSSKKKAADSDDEEEKPKKKSSKKKADSDSEEEKPKKKSSKKKADSDDEEEEKPKKKSSKKKADDSD